MKTIRFMFFTMVLAATLPWTVEAFQRGGRGGGGMRGGGGGRSMGAPQRSMGTPQRSMSVPQQRPNVSAPHMQAPQRPMPQPSVRSSTRPSTPQVNRPSGGMAPSTRPSQLPSVGTGGPSTRPSQLPSVGAGGGPGTRPSQLPSFSTPGGGMPTARPGGGLDRPSTLPSTRPSVGTGRPSTLPSTRPSAGQLDDFLGIHRPGGGPSVAPPIAGRPPGGRPNIDRPSNIQRPPINNNISQRPSWSNINNNRITQINNQWNMAINRPVMNNWMVNNPGRYQHWHGWGWGVASTLPARYPGYGGWFGSAWWGNYRHPCAAWHYWHQFGRYPFSYWWTVPVWNTLTNWVGWAAATPTYYDYGSGGNVVYQDNSVYIGGEQVATQEEFTESAAALATVPPPASEDDAAKMEWMPLGTFVVSRDKAETAPAWSIQLAVSKTGIIAGTLFNLQTEQPQTIQGQVDKQTQRVAFRIGDNQDIVVETGLYNLTQDEAPILVHFGKEKTETYLMVRIKQPEETSTSETKPQN